MPHVVFMFFYLRLTSFFPSLPLSTNMATVRPPKKRRTGHRLPPMVEGSDAAMDTAMYIRSEGGERLLVPVRPGDNNSGTGDSDPQPDPVSTPPHFNYDQPADMNMDCEQDIPPIRDRLFYMKEFVARVDEILQAMQAREVLPESAICADCGRQVAEWRCGDCIDGRLLCRSCMRHTHFPNPFHRIECWTGTHFRKAALWEVGVCLILPHQNSPGICDNLVWQRNMLEKLQRKKDTLPQTHVPISTAESLNMADSVADPERETSKDEATMRVLDEMLNGHNPDEVLEEDETIRPVDTEADLLDADAGTAGFTAYMQGVLGADSAAYPSQSSMPTPPTCDALSNQYVRVVHTNGVHHIALVTCTCRGHEKITTDLIYARWMPTSFVRVRTIFTMVVLDHFRYCNLEMRSSAYQFYQLLRRLTNTLNPSKVANLYHELRRLSRLWRWVKKLRWAGYAQKAGQPITPDRGELGNFCPACPQVGFNLPDDWKDDPNRWVFRRVFTADGNFKADHVRQKSAADDIWLSDGLGMTTKNSEYKDFLVNAKERHTVSGILHRIGSKGLI